MQAIFNGTVLAQSDDIVTLDGNPYFPREESPGCSTKALARRPTDVTVALHVHITLKPPFCVETLTRFVFF